MQSRKVNINTFVASGVYEAAKVHEPKYSCAAFLDCTSIDNVIMQRNICCCTRVLFYLGLYEFTCCVKPELGCLQTISIILPV